MAVTGVERMNRYIDAQHFPGDSGRGRVLLDQLRGTVDRLHARLSDDPALVAEDIMEVLPEIDGYLAKLRSWAEDTAHQSFSPTPHTGAQV